MQAMSDYHKYLADDLRSRFKVFLEGDLNRHLTTIKVAAEMNPPRVQVIIERAEILLESIERELNKLNTES